MQTQKRRKRQDSSKAYDHRIRTWILFGLRAMFLAILLVWFAVGLFTGESNIGKLAVTALGLAIQQTLGTR